MTPAARSGAKSGKRRSASTRSDDTKERILQHALQMFRERGYDGTSLNELADRVGITAAGLYWHYPNKASILFAALEGAMRLFDEQTAAAADETLTPHQRLEAFVRAHVLSQIERADYAELYTYGVPQLVGALTAAQRRKLRGLERAHVHRLEAILEAGKEAGDFTIDDIAPVAFAIIGMCEFTLQWVRPDDGLSSQAVADLYASLALRIVGAAP
jgi:AcrR family transcriptional regulator